MKGEGDWPSVLQPSGFGRTVRFVMARTLGEKTYRFCRPGVEGLRLSLGVPEVRYDELFVKR